MPSDRDPKSTTAPRSWKSFATRSDALLTTLAFPSTRAAFRTAEQQAGELTRFARKMPSRLARRGDDSGHAGTTTRLAFDLGIAEWLVARHPDHVEIDWHDASVGDALDELLRPTIRRTEEDGFDSDALTLRAWVRAARGNAWRSDLAWLLDALRDTGDSLPRRAAEWERAALPIVWKLGAAGVLHARMEVGSPVLRTSFRVPPARPARTITTPLRAIRLLPAARADRIIEVARETLAVRCREVHAISYANREEVWLADLGKGTSIAIIGVLPALRLSLEANYGFMLFSNGVPVGYGGVSPLFRQANTGINIFAPFRGTEAGMLWVRALQAFRTLFRVDRFIANPFQIGGGNTEALKSGAFWFYHRLGFRPSDPALAALADAELAQRQRDRSHRSPMATLKRLAGADLVLTLPGHDPRDAFDERWLGEISVRATKQLAAEGGVSRRTAYRRVAERIAATLGADRRTWSHDEREAFEHLAPIAAVIPDLGRWSRGDRRALLRIMRAKGGTRERDYVLGNVSAPRFLSLLARQCSPR